MAFGLFYALLLTLTSSYESIYFVVKVMLSLYYTGVMHPYIQKANLQKAGFLYEYVVMFVFREPVCTIYLTRLPGAVE